MIIINNIWAIGNTSIEKCNFRVKIIVFRISPYRFTIYPDYIIRIPWPPLSILGIFDCPVFSFPILQLYGGYDMIPANVIPNYNSFSTSEISFEFNLLEETRWTLTTTYSMPFIHSPASIQQTIDLVQYLCLGYLYLG